MPGAWKSQPARQSSRIWREKMAWSCSQSRERSSLWGRSGGGTLFHESAGDYEAVESVSVTPNDTGATIGATQSNQISLIHINQRVKKDLQ